MESVRPRQQGSACGLDSRDRTVLDPTTGRVREAVGDDISSLLGRRRCS